MQCIRIETNVHKNLLPLPCDMNKLNKGSPIERLLIFPMSTTTAETATGLSQLDQLKKFTKVVADTGDFETMRAFKPQDATTNPSLIYTATQKKEYAHLLDEVIADRKSAGLSGARQIEDIIDHVLVAFGKEILKIVPGRVSTETDARLSFNTQGSIDKARQLIAIYEKDGISREQIGRASCRE